MPIAHRIIPPLTDKDIARFWSKVRIRGLDECWPWTATGNKEGYGRFRIGGYGALSNRVAFFISNGSPPDTLSVLHKCDNPECCNPRHLFLGTKGENNQDKMAKGRHNPCRGEKNGRAKLSESQAMEIRRRFDAGGITQQALCEAYGVSKSLIHYIVRGHSWRHAPPAFRLR